ncbi:MAG: ribose-phosphate pyrophosphokinase [Desulfurococcales archaeon]|nr:ribose-phosphate pyrophosphokinase [Desulfurococcales archaeon]
MNKKLAVLAGTGDISLCYAQGISETLGLEIYQVDTKVFPDGESYIRLPEISNENIVLIQNLEPPQDKRIWEMLLTLDKLRSTGYHVILVAPYLAYSRQDKEFLKGEAISIALLLRLIRSLGADEFYTIEVHQMNSLKFFTGRAISLDPYPYMAGVLSDKLPHPSEVLVLSPDLGAIDRARRFADAFGSEFDYIVKRRDRITGEIYMEPKSIPVRNRSVVIVDDIISTGGTMAKAAKMLLEQGANNVYAVAAHGLFVGNAVDKLKSNGIKSIFVGDTLPDKEGVKQVQLYPIVSREFKWAKESL